MTDTFIQHCITVYNALNDRARDQKLESGETTRVFAGNYGEVFEAIGLSRTYYSTTRKALEKHGSISVLQRGGRNIDTVIVLLGLPDEWNIEGWNDGALTKPSEYATLRAEIRELKESLGGINVVKALAEFEKRVVTLEAQLPLKRRTTTTRNTKEK